MLIWIFYILLGCLSAKKYSRIGVVDVKDAYICIIQLESGVFIEMESQFCHGLHEGDIILIRRKNANR